MVEWYVNGVGKRHAKRPASLPGTESRVTYCGMSMVREPSPVWHWRPHQPGDSWRPTCRKCETLVRAEGGNQ